MENKPIVKNLEEGCLLALRYFGLFQYPLTINEIHLFNSFSSSINEVEKTLEKLTLEGKIHQIESFFLLKKNESWVEERKLGNKRAEKLLQKSKYFVKVIASFPFVRGIAISGSLSKFYASEKADIDYFIITESNRLWIARSLLHFYKKLTFLTGHQHYYCMNYFVDTNSLRIIHRNQYSAIETATLLPAFGNENFEKLFQENAWVKGFLPNIEGETNKCYLINSYHFPIKNIFEKLINLCFPDKLNHFFMKITDKKWRRKWKNRGYDEQDYEKAFYTSLHISKNHPDDYEKKVLQALNNTENQ